ETRRPERRADKRRREFLRNPWFRGFGRPVWCVAQPLQRREKLPVELRDDLRDRAGHQPLLQMILRAVRRSPPSGRGRSDEAPAAQSRGSEFSTEGNCNDTARDRNRDTGSGRLLPEGSGDILSGRREVRDSAL